MLAILPCGTPAYAQEADSETIAELLRLEEERCRAISEQDIDRLADLLSEDLVHVLSGGAVQDKATYVAGLRSRLSATPRRTYRGELTVRLYGDVAVMTGLMFNETGSGPPAERMVTQVWVRNAGSWTISSFQATPSSSGGS